MKQQIKLLSTVMIASIATSSLTIAQTTNYIPKWSGTAWVNTVTPIFEDATNSRIGIGTTSPATILDAEAATAIITAGINSGTAGNAGFQAKSNTASVSLVALMGGSTMASTLFGVNRANCGQIYTNNSPLVIGTAQLGDITLGTYNTANVTIKNGGNVGIGTTTPGYKLHIKSASSGDGLALERYASGANTVIDFKNENGVDRAQILFGGTNEELAIYPSGMVTPAMYFPATSGYVGLGTTSPSTQLHTTGGVRFATLTGTGTRMVTTDASGNLSTQTIPAGDNLGNGIASTNVQLNGHSLSNNGTGGISIDNSGHIGINATAGLGSSTLDIGGYTYLQQAVGIGAYPTSSLLLNVNGNCQFSTYTGIGGAPDGTLTYKLLVTGNEGVTGNITTNGDLSVGGNSTMTGALTIGGAGVINGGTYWQVSDARYKKNIEVIESPLQKVMKLKGVSYEFKREEFPKLNFREGKTIGFIAQELKEIFPEAVMLKADGYYAVNYQAIIPVLVEAMKEQQKIIDSLKTETANQNDINKSVQQQIEKLINSNPNHVNSSNATANTNVDLSDKNVVVLEQNVPNPFAEQTVINYNLSDNFTRAQIIFLNQSGKIIKTVDLTEKGKGTLNVFANDLTNGLYTYSLIIDGQTIETKKMVKTK